MDENDSLRQELSSTSFEELQQLKDKIGIKMFNKLMSNSTMTLKKKEFKRENKNRPREISSKKPVGMARDVFGIKKKKIRDPRFDDLSGEYNESLFQESYSFLNEMQQKEKMELKKQLKKETDERKRMKIKKLINKIDNQEKEKQKKKLREKNKKVMKQEVIEKLKEGKKPYFLKKSERKKLELIQHYKELKKSGKLEKYMQKKRKKNASRDSKWLKDM
ncbi:ribosomal RNA processing protein 36 homolog [Centruroides sculpturatus]|uniref:ribosomal RNA processing protein 36 homolog n=1 Tax=Centruroides sculpturatus TaxID=218467 RepID=UPI000C6CA555|nr:ribosomal RNA processing protein 36 homolog [Centruroides sculpturatus]